MKYLVTGCTGQMANYMADKLISEGHYVASIVRPSARNIPKYCNSKIDFYAGDITDPHSVNSIIKDIKPDQIINYAAFSQVGTSANAPKVVFDTNINGTLHILEAIRNICPETKGLFLGTSEIFGNSFSYEDGETFYQDEKTIPKPVSIYATSKLCAVQTVKIYREVYNLKCCSVIQFNTESFLRGVYFFPKKVANFVNSLKKNPKQRLGLGNIDGVYRDWSHAYDSITAHKMILDNTDCDCEYVIGSGETHSLREFLELAFAEIGIQDYNKYIYQDPKFVRPNELWKLCSDPSKIKQDLNWKPKIDFPTLVKMMIDPNLEKNYISSQRNIQ